MTAIDECNAALTDLRASQSYRQYKANGTLPRTKLGTCEQHLLAAIGLLNPTPPPPPDPGTLPPRKPGSPVDTSGKSNLTIADQVISMPVEWTNYDRAPVYLHGPCSNITGRNLELHGGYLGLKVYGRPVDSIQDCVFEDVFISGVGGDGVHIDGGVNLTLSRFHIGALRSDTSHDTDQFEHPDGCHIQVGQNIKLVDWTFDWTHRDSSGNVVRRDDDSSAIFLLPETGGLSNVQVIRPVCKAWTRGRFMQMLGVSGRIEAPVFQRDAIGTGFQMITMSAPRDGGKVELVPGGSWSNGVQRSDFFFTDSGGGSGPWPNYVIVRQ